jgi:hypothetical protein
MNKLSLPKRDVPLSTAQVKVLPTHLCRVKLAAASNDSKLRGSSRFPMGAGGLLLVGCEHPPYGLRAAGCWLLAAGAYYTQRNPLSVAARAKK